MRTTALFPFDPTDSIPAAIKCTIFYEDRATGMHGRHFAEMLAAGLGVACDCESLWRTEVVESFPGLADHAAGDAAKSDVIIFALRGDRYFPSHFKRWVESWCALKRDRGCAVVALFDTALETPCVASATRDFLRQICAAADVEFFASRSANDPSPATRLGGAHETFAERPRRPTERFSNQNPNRNNQTYTMKYLRISLLTVLVLATAGCDGVSDSIEYYFSSGGSLRHGTSASEDEPSDEATLVISSLP